MNPAQLLNPKAFAKQQAKAQSAKRPQNNGMSRWFSSFPRECPSLSQASLAAHCPTSHASPPLLALWPFASQSSSIATRATHVRIIVPSHQRHRSSSSSLSSPSSFSNTQPSSSLLTPAPSPPVVLALDTLPCWPPWPSPTLLCRPTSTPCLNRQYPVPPHF